MHDDIAEGTAETPDKGSSLAAVGCIVPGPDDSCSQKEGTADVEKKTRPEQQAHRQAEQQDAEKGGQEQGGEHE